MRIIDNYKDLPVGKYQEILDINADTEAEDIDRQVRTIAVLSDTDEDTILALSLPEYAALAARTAFLMHEDNETHKLAKLYDLGGLQLVPTVEARKVTTAQYIDFQTMTREGWDKHLVEVLSTLLVPKGHTYGNGYDIADVQDAIRRHLCVTDALSLLAFFFVSFKASITSTLISSRQTVKKARKAGKMPEAKAKELLERIAETEKMLSGGGGAG